MNSRHSHLSYRELQESDIPLIGNYWYKSDDAFLIGMGVDISKMVAPEALSAMLHEQLVTPLPEKKSYALIWLEDGKPIGHNNVGNIEFGKSATMHLHLWQSDRRRKGLGEQLLRLTVPHFFEALELDVLVCEPYALNPAPNRTLEKMGFRFVREYECIPGGHCFLQKVKRWEMQKDDLHKITG